MAFDYSSSFAGINNAINSFGKTLEDRRQRQTLADLGKQAIGGDYNSAAAAAFASGDAGTGLGLLKLGQVAREQADGRKLLQSWGIGGGETAALPAPTTGASAGDGAVRTVSNDTSDPLDAIMKFESGGRNVHQNVIPADGGYNPSTGTVTGPSSASGYFQMIDPTWRSAAKMAGIDTAKYPTAMSAPYEVQRAAAQALYNKEGFAPWAPYNARLRSYIAQRGGAGAFTSGDVRAASADAAAPGASYASAETGARGFFVPPGAQGQPAMVIDPNSNDAGSRTFLQSQAQGQAPLAALGTVPVPQAAPQNAPMPPRRPADLVPSQPAQAAPAAAPVQSVNGDDPAKLRADADYYEKTNPEAARQLRARADAVEAAISRGSKAAAPQPASPQADTRPATGAPAEGQGFAIPQGSPPAVENDKDVKLWQDRYSAAAATGNERAMKIAEKRLEMATKSAERRYNEGKAPEAVREWQWARQNGMTTAKNPTAYAAELAAAKRDPDSDVTNLRKEVQQLPSYKNLQQAAPIYRSMFDTAGRNTKASDLNLVYGLGKIMDPTSVVREGEMIMVKNSAGMSAQFLGAINALNGGAALTPETRHALMQEAYSRMDTYRQQFDQDMSQYRGIVQRRGFNADDVIPNIGEFKAYEAPAKAAKSGQPSPTAAPAQSRPVESQYVRPDGSSPPTPSAPAAPAGPRRGELVDGYRFKGGDAGKAENWVKVK